jgi:hypothetical protein
MYEERIPYGKSLVRPDEVEEARVKEELFKYLAKRALSNFEIDAVRAAIESDFGTKEDIENRRDEIIWRSSNSRRFPISAPDGTLKAADKGGSIEFCVGQAA